MKSNNQLFHAVIIRSARREAMQSYVSPLCSYRYRFVLDGGDGEEQIWKEGFQEAVGFVSV